MGPHRPFAAFRGP